MLWYNLTFIALGDAYDLLYIVPMSAWLLFMATLATLKTRYTYKEELGFFSFLYRAYVRLVPYIVINSGMLPHQVMSLPPLFNCPHRLRRWSSRALGPHLPSIDSPQFCSFLEGLIEPMHAEFERTPKRGGSLENLPGAPHPLSQKRLSQQSMLNTADGGTATPPRADSGKSHGGDEEIMIGTGPVTEPDSPPKKKVRCALARPSPPHALTPLSRAG
jgi:hypothetical protein